jgi:predicted DNA-binding protein (UPF0251 family)
MSSSARQNWAAVIGDVVGSRQVSSRSRLQQRLDKALAAVNTIEASFLLRVELVGKVDVRMGIGWGSLRIHDPNRTPFGQDGPCWWRARDALGELARTERSNQEPNSLRTVCRTGNAQEQPYNSILVLRDHILAGIDEADATILKLVMSGASQQEAAARLGINKSSVSRRMQSHGLAALLRSREHLMART